MKKAITKHWIAKASIDYSVTTLKEIGYKATISKPWFPENPNGLMKIHWKSSKFFPPTVEGKKDAQNCAERKLNELEAQ